MSEPFFNFQQGSISTPFYNHQGLSVYQDPFYSNPYNSSQLPVPVIDTFVQAINATKVFLSELSGNSQKDYIMGTAFGFYNQESANPILTDWAQNNFTGTPHIELVFGQNFNGAYAKDNDTIYLSGEFLAANKDNVEAVTGVLLEEVGHYLDSQINVVDATGDEGDIWSKLLRGQSISSGELVLLKGEDDHGFVIVDGLSIGIEKSEVALASLNGRLYQSIRGQDSGIYTRSSTDGLNWTSWNNNGGGGTPSGVDLEILNGRLYQSHRGFDNRIYTRSSTDGVNWTGWNNNGGGDTPNDPSLALFNGRLYQSHRGLDNRIYTRSSTDGVNWTGWNNNGGGDTPSAPVIEAFNGRLYQSHRGLDNAIYTRSSTDGVNWTGWNNNGGGGTPSAPVIEAFNGRLYQSHRGFDNAIYTRSSTDGYNWTGWNNNGGGGTPSDPSLEAFNSRLYQSHRGFDNKIYTRSSTDGYNWTGWSEGSTISDNAGNTLATARDIGTLNSSRSFSDWVGAADTNDYYRFYVSGRSNFNLNLTGLSGDADVQLLNSVGTVITSSTAGGSSTESINTQLGTGTYYVRVYPWSIDSTNYNLSLNATRVNYSAPATINNSGWQSVLNARNNDFGSLPTPWYLKPGEISTELAIGGLANSWSTTGNDDAAELLYNYLNENNGGRNYNISFDEAIRESSAYKNNILNGMVNNAWSTISGLVRSDYYSGQVNNNWMTATGNDWGNNNWKWAVGGHHVRYTSNYQYSPETDIVTVGFQFLLKDVYDFASFDTSAPDLIDFAPHALHLSGAARAFEVSGTSSTYEWQFRLSSGTVVRNGFA